MTIGFAAMPVVAGHWVWLVVGLVLVGLEVLVPGFFLVWLGLAALVTGAVASLLDPSWQVSLLVFVAAAIASVLLGRFATRSGRRRDAPETNLNRRGEALVGRRFVLDRPIAGGEGQVRVDDSVWRAVGPDLPPGATVRVSRLDGATLVVEAC